MLADAVGLYSIWFLLVWGYWAVGLGHYDPHFYCRMWPVGLVFISLNVLFRLYHGSWLYPAAPLEPVEEMRRLMGSAFITHIAVIAFLALTRQTTHEYSRFIIAASGLLTMFLAQPFRDLARVVLFTCGLGQIPVYLAGAGSTADRLAAVLSGNRYVGFRVVRRMERNLHDLVPAARKDGVRILLACQDERLFRAQLPELTEWFRHIEYLPTLETFPVHGSRTVSFDGVGGIEMVNQSRMRSLRVEKWILDKTLAVVAMIVLSPLFVVIPVLIKLTSRGPVFYGQTRLGRHGRPIRVWKFRSMYRDADARREKLLAENPQLAAEWKANFKLAKDPRITPLGRLLRKTSLDEIPQLFNVFTGSMALVGPRPIVEAEVSYYGVAYEIFSSVKPGITGLWQTAGRSNTDYARRVALDTRYVLNWSLWLDIWIILKTVYAVVLMRGAC